MRSLARQRVEHPVAIDVQGRGGPTPGQARGPGWRRTSHGLYVPADTDPSCVEQRIAESAAVLPRFGGVTGWAALRWHGGVWFSGRSASGLDLPVDLAVGGDDIRPQPGLRVSHERLNVRELQTVDGVRVTDVLRSLFFALRHAPSLWAAVETLDMAAYSDLVARAELQHYLASQTGWTGVDRARRALALGDENSWSPRETWLRLVWVLVAGLDPPLTNRPVFDHEGHHLGTPDLLDPACGLVAEYDGELHLAGSRRRRDLERLDAFREAGLEPVVVVAGDTDVRVAERLVRAWRRARDRARSGGPSGWTSTPPGWWVTTHSVAARRDLSQADRDRWLRTRLEVG